MAEKKKPTKKETKKKIKSADSVKSKKIEKKPVKKKTRAKKKDSSSALTKKGSTTKPIKAEEPDEDALKRDDMPMSMVGHLHELRSRIIVTLITIIAVTLIAFFFSEYVLKIVTMPYLKSGMQLNVFTLVEGIMIRLKASLLVAVLVGLPVIFYELWKYIQPAIDKNDRRFIRISVIISLFLMYGGILFSFFLLLPTAIKMLLKFTPDDMNPVIGASQYLNFFLLFSLAMGIIFELPIIVMILTKMGILSPEILTSKRKYAIVLIWIFSAIITPPDLLSQTLIAIPVMLLYEISVIISKLIIRNKLKKEQSFHYK